MRPQRVQIKLVLQPKETPYNDTQDSEICVTLTQMLQNSSNSVVGKKSI